MNVQDYRKKFSKYIEKELRSRIEDLATVWQPAKLGDLYQVLCDWMDIQTDPIGMVQQKIPSPPLLPSKSPCFFNSQGRRNPISAVVVSGTEY